MAHGRDPGTAIAPDIEVTDAYDRMVELVARREELAVELGSSRVYDEVRRLSEERSTIDADIERVVAELFELTPDEVSILEEHLDGK